MSRLDDDTSTPTNPRCDVDGSCDDPNAQCNGQFCVCRLGYYFKGGLCGKNLVILKIVIEYPNGHPGSIGL